MSDIDEAELLGAGRSGTVADAATDGEKRTVQAALLRRCCYELKDQIDPRGLRLTNAIVVGCLDLAGLSVPFPLRFDGCEFDSVVVAEGAELFELSGSRARPGRGAAAYPLALAGLGRAPALGQHRLAAADDEPRPSGDRPAVVDGVSRP
jgi:hypothetical protein